MNDEPIEEFLDRLWLSLSGAPREARRTLAEVETHLHEAAEAHEAAGLPRLEAERRAVADFGEPHLVSPRVGLRDLLRPAALFGAIGFFAIAASGLVASVLRGWGGAVFLAGDPGVSYSPARCDYFREYYPSTSCFHSAALHHADELVAYRLATGLLGVLLLLVWWRLPRGRALAPALVPLAGVAVYGAATALLIGLSYDRTRFTGNDGAGQWLSAAIVSAVVALAYAVRAYRPVVNRPLVAPRQP